MNDSNLYTEDIKEGTYAFSGCKGGSSSTYYLALELETANSSGAKYFNLTETNISSKGFLPVEINSQNKYRTYIYVESGAEVNATVYPQLEEGAVTPYAPYNSLEVKVEGKNKFNGEFPFVGYYANYIGGLSQQGDRKTTGFIKVKPNTAYSLKEFNGFALDRINEFTDANNNTFVKSNETFSVSDFAFTTTATTEYIQFTVRTDEDVRVQLELGTPTDYEPYKSQTAYFPLAEGQKLMEGSYLADDGVHNTRVQVVFTGSETITWYIYEIPNTDGFKQFYCAIENFKHSNTDITTTSNQFKGSIIGNRDKEGYNNTVYTYSGGIAFRKDEFPFSINAWKTYLAEQYANGTPVIVEYELAEEEIVPYTEEQQKAWNKIKALTTYKNITNITSEAYAKVVYMRDNGLDVYETKQNADKRYTETTEKFAEQKITVDGVITQVSDTNKKLTNEYLTAEQVNAELDTTNENIEILSQKQAKTELTSEQFRIDIDKIVNEGVSKVKTSMGYTFDDEGFKLDREGAETGTIIDEAKIKVVDKTGSSETDLLYAGYVKEGNTDYPEYVGQTIVASANMIVKNYLVVPNSRFEKYENPVLGGQGTGAFEV